MPMTTNTKRGALIVHGLTATPATMSPTMEAMEDAGYVVSAPLLPGHGTTVEDLEHTTWHQWTHAVSEAYAALAAQCESIYYIGLSLGALLGLQLAANVTPAVSFTSKRGPSTGSPLSLESHCGDDGHTKLRALALMGTPLHLSPFVRRIVPVVRYTPVRWIYTASPKDWKTSVADPDGLKVYQESSYDRIPTKAVYQIYDLERVVQAQLGKIHTPTLLIHSHQDEVAPPSNVTELCAKINNPEPEVLWVDHSYHVISLDYDRESVNQTIIQFCERHAR